MIVLVLWLAVAVPGVQAEPPPLSAEQVKQVRQLTQRTQNEQSRLAKALASAQEALSGCYAEYDLNTERVNRLQAEILELQRDLLANHHSLQTELRKIVGAERFKILSRRIENALRSPAREPTQDLKREMP